MTRRRKDGSFSDDLYEMLLVVPSWVGPPLAMLFFLALRFLIPAIIGGSEKPSVGTIVAGVAHAIALPVAGLVLFAWLIAELQKWRRRRLLDGQSGLESIRGLSWQEFEHLVGEAYRRMGYVVQETGNTGGDGGIDLSLARGGERVVVQCKQWRTRRVGVRPVRELYGVMTGEGASSAILVTCGSFTKEAKLFAEGKPLTLVEGPELCGLVRAVKTGGNATPVVGAGQPTAESPSAHGWATAVTQKCPLCGSEMVLRTAKKGQHAGSRFWGCSKFPTCRGTRQLEPG